VVLCENNGGILFGVFARSMYETICGSDFLGTIFLLQTDECQQFGKNV